MKIDILLKRVLLSVISCLVLSSSIYAKDKKDHRFTIQDIPNITSETKKDFDGVRNLTENYIIKNVKKSNAMIEDTKKEIEKSSKDLKKQQKEFIKGLKEVTEFYEKISAPGTVNKTKDELMSYYRDVQNFNKGLDQIERTLQAEIRTFESDLSKYSKNSDALTPTEKTLKKSKEQQMKFSKEQLKMIQSYKLNYEGVLPVVEKVQNDVDFFILNIEESAKVYRKAYETAELSLNISNAIDTLGQFDDLISLTNDIQESWSNLDSIITTLTELTLSL